MVGVSSSPFMAEKFRCEPSVLSNEKVLLFLMRIWDRGVFGVSMGGGITSVRARKSTAVQKQIC